MKTLFSLCSFLLALNFFASMSVSATTFPLRSGAGTELKKLCEVYAKRYHFDPADSKRCDQLHRAEIEAGIRLRELRNSSSAGIYCLARQEFLDSLAIQKWANEDLERRYFLLRRILLTPQGTAVSQTQVEIEMLALIKAEAFKNLLMGQIKKSARSCRVVLNSKDSLFWHEPAADQTEDDVKILKEFFRSTTGIPAELTSR